MLSELRDFISGYYVPEPRGDSRLGIRLDSIQPTNLGPRTWLWIKNLLKGALDSVCERLINLSVYAGTRFGQLSYNAQYPYLQKALRIKMSDNTITVHDGIGLAPMIVYPSANEDTAVIDGGTVVYPSVSYAIAPFIIHSDRTLTDGQKNRIIAETSLLKFSGTRYVIDYPQTSSSSPSVPNDEIHWEEVGPGRNF